MVKTFEVNGKTYDAVTMDFNAIADLEEMGVDLMSGNLPMFKTLRGYFALCAGISAREAGEKLNAHVVAGGHLDGLLEAFKYECENSGFINPEKRTPAIKPVEN